MEDATHQSVLLEETIDWLQPRPGVGFRALDCTLGAGGHAYALLERSAPDGALIGLDADPSALARVADRLAPFQGRFRLVHANFGQLSSIQMDPRHAIVFDLGLSSPQLDNSGRGFSFRFDEALDMRFDPSLSEQTAADVLNTSSQSELEKIFWEYGEERRGRRLAQVVVQRRAASPFARTGDLVAAVTQAVGPQRGRIHPATRAFQALRIAVNDELGVLERGLDAALTKLAPGGRLAVISFHSLEDRIVKWRMRGWAESGLVQVLTRKPQVPSESEVARNPRARSAKLRVAEKVVQPRADAERAA